MAQRMSGVLDMVPGKAWGGHWFRPRQWNSTNWHDLEPCAFRGCGRAAGEHYRWCGEWQLARRERWSRTWHRMVAQWRSP